MRKVSNEKTGRISGIVARAAAGAMAALLAGAALTAVPYNVLADEVIMEWREENGVKYWYENGVRQGVKYNADGSIDTSYRGKEIYDPSTEAWYWLDCVQNGAVAKNKDVYQESAAGQWGASTDENGEKVGKWVRYDENGHMVKGWQTTEAGTYYFDPVYGTMAKGDVVIDGQSYYFNKDTGILERSGQTDDDGNSFLTDGWHKVDGVNYWYENGVRQGVKYNADGSIDTSYRGKEIYDPSTEAWYWLDCVQNGAVAKNKDVYQESAAGQWGAGTNENGEKVGKWVRYDENGYMVKGWNEKDGNKYYFDPVYGTMAKGMVDIEGKKYEFDSVSGIFAKEVGDENTGNSDYTEDNDKEIVPLGMCTLILSQDSYEYDGTEKKPEVVVKNGDKVIPSTEYTVSYCDNIYAGSASVWVDANEDSTIISGDNYEYFNIVVTKNKLEWNLSDDGKLTVTGNAGGKIYKKTGFGEYIYPWDEYKDQIKSAYINVTGVQDLARLFYDCINLTEVDLSGLDTSNVTDMSAMFWNCKNLLSLDLSGFDTSKVTAMDYMFYNCNSLSSLNISNFDTSQVTDMRSMFNECNSLTNLDLGSFDTSQVTDMVEMFYNCNSLKKLDLSNFDTSQVTRMYFMFRGCSSLESLDVSNFNTSKGDGMVAVFGMFSGCSSVKNIDLSNFDTSHVDDMGGMFTGCSSLESLDLSSFDTSNVTDMGGMFSGCKSLTSLNLNSFDTAMVKDMTAMFMSCSSLTSLDLRSFTVTQNTSIMGMFGSCNNLKEVVVSSKWSNMDSSCGTYNIVVK